MAGTDPSASAGEKSASGKVASAAAATDPSNPAKHKEHDLPQGVTKKTPPRQSRWVNVPEFFKLPEGLLDPESSWSNDPSQMQMQIYFSRNPEVPGLAESFNLDNLIPVIVKPDSDRGYTYVLTVYGQKQPRFYLWNEMDGQMRRFKETDLQKVVDMVVFETYGGDALEQQGRSQLGSWGQIG